ncbi:hypothetical protein GA0061070_103849 [Kosakonia oryziphila]|uniref:Uncharacterized protein n=1 Tax=Kosakonia oryziphila TaxID=1005667 RepID=A0A1C4FLX1_9ENTR|nr:hypothetical protein GA0061070_103849 [Kosakonia oryziphila]
MKPVVLVAKLTGKGQDPWGGVHAEFDASGKIALKEFNIMTEPEPASQNVALIISAEGVQQK